MQKIKGCIQFSRLEGAYFSEGTFWFDDTSAGEKRLGRIYRYTPATNTLELFYESSDRNDLKHQIILSLLLGEIFGLLKTAAESIGSSV